MDPEERQDMISIWQNVFIAVTVNNLAQLMLLFKVQTLKTQQLLMNNYSMINKNY